MLALRPFVQLLSMKWLDVLGVAAYPVIPACGRLRQENCQPNISLAQLVRYKRDKEEEGVGDVCSNFRLMDAVCTVTHFILCYGSI